MRKVEELTSSTGERSYKVQFRHGTNPQGKPLQTSETFTHRPDAERFTK